MDSGDRLRTDSLPSTSSRFRSPVGTAAGSGRDVRYGSSTGDARRGLSGLRLDRLCRLQGRLASSSRPSRTGDDTSSSAAAAARRRCRRPSPNSGCSSSSDVCTDRSMHGAPPASAAAGDRVSSFAGRTSSIVGDRWTDVFREPRSELGRGAAVTSAVVVRCLATASRAWPNAPSTLTAAAVIGVELEDDLTPPVPRRPGLELFQNLSTPHAVRLSCALYQ